MNRTLRNTLSVVALAGASVALPSFAAGFESQEAWGNQMVQMQAQGQGLSRAEVQADMNLWRRAGLQGVNTGETPTSAVPGYTERLAEYQRLRSGPEYVAEVRSLGGDVSTVAGYDTGAAMRSTY